MPSAKLNIAQAVTTGVRAELGDGLVVANIILRVIAALGVPRVNIPSVYPLLLETATDARQVTSLFSSPISAILGTRQLWPFSDGVGDGGGDGGGDDGDGHGGGSPSWADMQDEYDLVQSSRPGGSAGASGSGLTRQGARPGSGAPAGSSVFYRLEPAAQGPAPRTSAFHRLSPADGDEEMEVEDEARQPKSKCRPLETGRLRDDSSDPDPDYNEGRTVGALPRVTLTPAGRHVTTQATQKA